jgi:hypothetical protein
MATPSSNKSGWAIEHAISLAAVVIAAAALLSALYDGCQNRHHLRLSVRPHMTFNFIYTNDGTGWTLRNHGLGPAIVKSFTASVDGKPQSNWNAVAAALGLPRFDFEFSIPTANTLVPPNPGGTGRIFWVSSDPVAKLLRENRERVTLEICYCSLYEECWSARTDFEGPKRQSCNLEIVFHSPRGQPWKAD